MLEPSNLTKDNLSRKIGRTTLWRATEFRGREICVTTELRISERDEKGTALIAIVDPSITSHHIGCLTKEFCALETLRPCAKNDVQIIPTRVPMPKPLHSTQHVITQTHKTIERIRKLKAQVA